ncbi:hypothetical protein BO94DRAFT_583239 [Aspergillus sclerotioniger CBS 115572]|uniref:Uncharacterized protein n=1 Tax=Aspergillus sclerotioniger CBS 115572 TaxID=1450535 RepID=A0A317X362_9EURO|nr:hypothetical protein BO94DRAFT_583239 [Aspergillus sclerotioniger CBS 115572]PWY92996.1 hypothetical protein BO94DRAFT_583239 [Aspergillus sclerotioniger CBS 115572]
MRLTGLWDEAYAELEKEHPKLVHFYETDLLAGASDQSEVDLDRQKQLATLVQSKLKTIEAHVGLSLGGSQIVVRDQARKVARMIVGVKDFISAAVSAEPHASLAWAGVLVLIPILLNLITQHDDAAQGVEYISDLLIRPAIELKELCASIRGKTIRLYSEILQYEIRLAKQYSHGASFHALRDFAVADNWKEMLTSVKTLEQSIKTDLETLGDDTAKRIDTTVAEMMVNLKQTRDDLQDLKQAQILQSLPLLRGLVPIPSRTNTNPDAWKGHSSGSSNKFKLGAMSLPKSPSSAFKEWLAQANRPFLEHCIILGGSFFFNHAEYDRNNAKMFFTTLARHLKDSVPDTRMAISEVISRNPGIATESLSNQWKYLILQPLLRLESNLPSPRTLVFVIDALDECKDRNDLETIVQLLSQFTKLKKLRIRVFITSRPEIDIRRAFQQVPKGTLRDEILSKVITMEAENKFKDYITRLLEYELSQVSTKHCLGEHWPGNDKIATLVRKSDGLFIYAATVCRFLGGNNLTKSRVKTRLDMILEDEYAKNSPQKSLDDVYRRILEVSVIGDADEVEERDILGSFRRVVGSIVVLFDPLSTGTLGDLLSIQKSDIEETLEGLYSVVTVPKTGDMPIQLVHLSFPNFFLGDNRCADTRFHIDESEAHRLLFGHCVKAMSNTLKRDICSLRKPGIFKRRMKHLLKVKSDVGFDETEAFLNAHLTHWLEAMSLIGLMREAVSLVIELFEHVSVPQKRVHTELYGFLYDARRFVLNFRAVIEEAPLQVYCSALYFAPEDSIIRSKFWYETPIWIHQFPTMEKEWSSLLQVLEGHRQRVQIVEFPPNDRFIASASDDRTIKIWDSATGAVLQTFEGYREPVICVAFSSTSKLLASGGQDGAVVIWDISLGSLLRTFERKGPITAVTFSTDDKMGAFASDKGIFTWDLREAVVVFALRARKPC